MDSLTRTTSTRNRFLYNTLAVIGSITILGAILFGVYTLGTKSELSSHSNIAKIDTTTTTITSAAAVTTLVATQTITSTPTPTANPYAGWSTYTNSSYGYSLKYPPTWTINSSAGEITTIPSNPNCKWSYISFTTPESYKIDFHYNMDNCPAGTMPAPFSKSQVLAINGEANDLKIYFGDCGDTSTTVNQKFTDSTTCKNYFTQIAYNNNSQDIETTGTAGTIFTLNGKLSSLILTTNQYYLAITDPTFKTTDDMLNNVVASIRFPH